MCSSDLFGFYSPSEEEYDALREALETEVRDLPAGGGVSDGRFPSLAPLQVLILPDVASSADNDDVPSFVFVRSRNDLDPAVTDEP